MTFGELLTAGIGELATWGSLLFTVLDAALPKKPRPPAQEQHAEPGEWEPDIDLDP